MTNQLGKKISDRFLMSIGLFENILGKYSNNIAYNQEKEQYKKILHEVYGYKDIYKVIPPELDEEGMQKFLNTVFTYHENPLINEK